MGQTGKVWLSGVWYALTAERPTGHCWVTCLGEAMWWILANDPQNGQNFGASRLKKEGLCAPRTPLCLSEIAPDWYGLTAESPR